MTDIRQALRRGLEDRGLQVADDTFASRNELYVIDDGITFPGLDEALTRLDG